MRVSPQAQAVLLLTTPLSGRGADTGARPLTNIEWSRVAKWLHERGRRPEHLLADDRDALLAEWHDEKLARDRLEALLERGPALALALDKWLGAGLWILTRADADYPKRWKERLAGARPSVLFGCGPRSRLQDGGLVVVGSRNAPPADLEFSRMLGARAATAGTPIVSGGARGVDEEAMLGALEEGGTAVGVVADNLLRAIGQERFRLHVQEERLALVSPYQPEAPFNTGNAMGRNRFVYCLADAAVVVHSGRKGGTWSGAGEAIKRGWVPVWVKPNDDARAGNADLIAQGGRPLEASADGVDIEQLRAAPRARPDHVAESPASPPDLYEVFLAHVERLCAEQPRGSRELADALDLQPGQVQRWLKRATEEKRVKKRTRPVRYEPLPPGAPNQMGLFDA